MFFNENLIVLKGGRHQIQPSVEKQELETKDATIVANKHTKANPERFNFHLIIIHFCSSNSATNCFQLSLRTVLRLGCGFVSTLNSKGPLSNTCLSTFQLNIAALVPQPS